MKPEPRENGGAPREKGEVSALALCWGPCLGGWLEALDAAVPLAREGEEPEGAHQLRVALARLSVGATLASAEALLRELRWLRRSAAAVRDLDVRLAQQPPESVARGLREERRRARVELRAVLDSARVRDLRRDLGALAPPEEEEATQGMLALLEGALARGRRYEEKPRKEAALHALRRALRRARFGLELFGGAPKELTRMQSALGEVCDRFLLLAVLRESASPEPAVEDFARGLERELRRGRAALGPLWKRARRALLRARRALR